MQLVLLSATFDFDPQLLDKSIFIRGEFNANQRVVYRIHYALGPLNRMICCRQITY